MATNLVINGVSYPFPQDGDNPPWGNNVASWAAAVTSGMLQKSSGTFALLVELDFGSSFGVKSLYYKTRSSNVADAGQFRLGVTDTINFRNNANSGNLPLAVNGSDQLTFNGTKLAQSGSIVNADVSVSAAIAYSKLALSGAILNSDLAGSIAATKLVALTANRIVMTDSSGVITAVSPNIVNVQNYGARGDGSTDDTTAINTAIAIGGTIYFPATSSYYKCSNNLTVSAAGVRLTGDGIASKIVFADGKGLLVTAGNFQADNVHFDGTDYSTGTTSKLISISGVSSNSYISNFRIENCHFTQAPFYAIYTQWCSNVTVVNNFVDTVYYCGLAFTSTNNIVCNGNTVKNILGSSSGSSYGIFFSQVIDSGLTPTGTWSTSANTMTVSSASGLVIGQYITALGIAPDTQITNIASTTVTLSRLTTASGSGVTLVIAEPYCKGGVCSGNLVVNNPTWEGIDTHSAHDITFENNTVIDCIAGIGCGSSGTFKAAPKRIVIKGNVLKGYSAFDSTKTVTGTTTAMTMSAAPNYTISVGDYLVVGTEGRRITALSSQTSYTIASSFSSDPSTAACTVTQLGKNKYGITCVGADGATMSTPFDTADGCIIVGNSISYFGEEANADSAAVYTYNTRGLILNNNAFFEPNGAAILLYYASFGTSISGNTCIDAWSFGKSNPMFMSILNDYIYAVVTGNCLKSGGFALPHYTNQYGFIFAGSPTHLEFVVADNTYDWVTANLFDNCPTGIRGNTPWVAFTPTGTWSTNTTYTGFWRLNGDELELRISLALAGAPTTASLAINMMPSGWTANTAKVPGQSTYRAFVGTGLIVDLTHGNGTLKVDCRLIGGTSVDVSSYAVTGSKVFLAAVDQASPFTFANNEYIYLDIKVPI